MWNRVVLVFREPIATLTLRSGDHCVQECVSCVRVQCRVDTEMTCAVVVSVGVTCPNLCESSPLSRVSKN